MKAKIFEIKRFAVHDGDGIRTTVFFKGCPLKCVWCHNPEGLSAKPEIAYFPHKCIGCGQCVAVCQSSAHSVLNNKHVFDRTRCIACGKCQEACLGEAIAFYGKQITVDELLPVLLRDKDFYDNSGGGVTLSGGECLLYADFCAELLKKLKENGVDTAVDTCGYVPQAAFEKVLPYTDIFLYDIKAFDEQAHLSCTGQSNKRILENLFYLDGKQCKIEIRIPLVPGYNDTQIQKIGQMLAQLKNLTKVRVLPYHNLAGSKYQSLDISNTLPATVPTKKQIDEAVNTLKALGLNVI